MKGIVTEMGTGKLGVPLNTTVDVVNVRRSRIGPFVADVFIGGVLIGKIQVANSDDGEAGVVVDFPLEGVEWSRT